MRIVVTGGSGRVGKFVIADLAAAGHEVTSLDLAPSPDRLPGIRYMLGNAARPEDIFGTLAYAKAEAVIHLAAWSDPGIVPDPRTYTDNAAGTFNVLDAAESLKLRRVILTSSAQVYGFAGHPPVSAPVTEDHPLRPLNAYALSKVAGEQAADYFARRGLNILTFRIMGVRAPADLQAEIARAITRSAEERFLLWTRTDARDAAEGFRLAIEKDHVESGIYNLSGARNYLGTSSRGLLSLYSAETDISQLADTDASPFSSAKASKAFGYQPRFVWTREQSHWPS